MAATLLLYPRSWALRRAGWCLPLRAGRQDPQRRVPVVLFLALLATFVAFALVLAGVI